MSRTITLTDGQVARVDDRDYHALAQRSWYPVRGAYTTYAARYDSQTGGTLYMHREITGAPRGKHVDHVNHNGLDNRRANLRVCSRQQNGRNRRPNRNASSRYKGVCLHKQSGKWVAYLYHNGRRHHLGLFACEHEAALAYNREAQQRFGEYARLNQVPAAALSEAAS